MEELKLFEVLGSFAEDKDIAKEIRTEKILPALENGGKVILNFQGVEAATQSFIHALISDVIRKKGIEALDYLFFKNCNETVREIINIVVEYMQDEEYK